MPLALPYQGHVVLATFACAIVWWITQPLPWAVATMLPFLVFPAAGVMDIVATMRLYGQPIFFWIMGTVLMGHAIEKHGLARRFAISFLALPGIGGRTDRLLFGYMLAVGLISMCVSDATTIAMTIPIGAALARHVKTIAGTPTDAGAHIGTFITLGTLYAAVAGGTATIMGIPHNAIAASVLARVTGHQIGFFEWMRIGVPVFLALLLTFYATLWVLARPDLRDVPGGEAFLRAERAKLGPMRAIERRVVFVFAVMVALFTLPTIASVTLGEQHAIAAAINRALPFWMVPPAVMFLLFTVRSPDEAGAALLTWKDAEQHSPWNTMILVAGAVGMTDALAQFGFVDFVSGIVRNLGIGPTTLPYLAASVVAFTTNFFSGTAATALFSSVLFLLPLKWAITRRRSRSSLPTPRWA